MCLLSQITNHMMVTSMKEVDLPQPRFEKEKIEKSNRRQTRGVKKVHEAEGNVDCHDVSDEPIESHARRKNVSKQGIHAKGKRKAKTLSPAVVDVIFGNAKNSDVANVDELRCKMEQDAVKCGLQIKSVLDVQNQNPSGNKSPIVVKVPSVQNGSIRTGTSEKTPEASQHISGSVVLIGVFQQEKCCIAIAH